MNLQERISALAVRIAQEIKGIRTVIGGYYTKTEVDTKLNTKADKTTTYTKTETDAAINAKVAGLYKPKGSKATYADLPATGNSVGDVWNVVDTGMNYAWVGGTAGENGDGWDALGGVVDLSDYYTKTETEGRYALRSRTITAGAGLTGGGNLGANRTLAVNFGTDAGTAAQGNDSRFHTHGNKSVLDGTTASFTTTLKAKLDGIETGANKYELPIASSTVLGGIKVGNNLSINSDGVLSATNSNTTYSAGAGLTLAGTVFSLPVNITGSGTYVQKVEQTTNGINVTLGTPPNTNTTYNAGTKTLIDAGTDTANRVWPAKILKEAIVEHGGKTYTAGTNVQISASNVISATDTKYTHPTTAGNKHIPAGGAARNYLKWSASGTAVWSGIVETDVESNTDYVAIFEANL